MLDKYLSIAQIKIAINSKLCPLEINSIFFSLIFDI